MMAGFWTLNKFGLKFMFLPIRSQAIARFTFPMSSQNESNPAHQKKTSFGWFSCICCGQRYWKKNKLVRRAAHCRGQNCKAWRCRFNDQCPQASSPCPMCGTFKPSEYQSAISAGPVLQHHSGSDPQNDAFSCSSVSLPEHDQPAHSERNQVLQPGVQDARVTPLPLLEGMYVRFLTEV